METSTAPAAPSNYYYNYYYYFIIIIIIYYYYYYYCRPGPPAAACIRTEDSESQYDRDAALDKTCHSPFYENKEISLVPAVPSRAEPVRTVLSRPELARAVSTLLALATCTCTTLHMN